MSERRYTLKDAADNPVIVVVRRDRRLRKSGRWMHQPDGSILLRVPFGLPGHELDRMLQSVVRQASAPRRRTPRTDADLQARAEYLNRRHFKGALRWTAIRWVGNMQHRLGSCTHGGPADGHIRISERIKEWPQWVVDYVIAHELVHTVHPDHSPAFWQLLNEAYPLAERARGFIAGVSFARGLALEDD